MFCSFDYCIVDSWMVMFQYYWFSGIDIVDICFVIDIIKICVVCFFDKQWGVVYVSEGVNRGVYVVGDQFVGCVIEIFRFIYGKISGLQKK